jgi:hypothetical protein
MGLHGFTGLRRLTLAFVVGALALVAGVRAADKVTLKDGTVIEGSIVREESGYVWIKTSVNGIDDERMFAPTDISSIDREKPKTPTTTPDAAKSTPSETPPTKPEAKPTLGKAPRAAVITLGEGEASGKDMVGIYMTAEALKRAIPLLEEEKIEIVVFRVNSGGGALSEIQKLSDMIQNEYKPRFTVVGWIESAISAAAMTSHTIENIYFLPQGNYGACTGWHGQGTAMKGRALEEVLFMMEKISARGNHPKEIMRSMEIMEPLSCTIDENGQVTWFQSLDGQYIVNPEQRILTFNAQDAMKYKFAKGIANDIDELGKAMGYPEVIWVGEQVPNVPYPVCKAEKLQRDFRAQAFDDEKRLREYEELYERSLQLAEGAPKADRGKYITRARENFEKIKKMIKNNPNFALRKFGIDPEKWNDFVQREEERIRKIANA